MTAARTHTSVSPPESIIASAPSRARNRRKACSFAGHMAPVRVIAPPRARGVLGPFRRHEAGKHRAFGMRLRQARAGSTRSTQGTPVGSFGEERLHVDAQVNGPGAGCGAG